MKTYIYFITGMAVIACLVGFVLPWLISAEDTFLVLIGIVGVFIVIPLFVWVYFHYYIMKIIKKSSNGSKE